MARGVIVPETSGAAEAVAVVAVVVPSFGRPELLARCLAALSHQRLPPAEVLVVGRESDEETARVASEAPNARFLTVSARGHLPPLAAGVDAASADVVCFVDDDAEPWPEWTERLARHYADPSVGGAGGLVAQPGAGERTTTGRVGRMSSTGRFDRLHHERVPRTWGPRDVDALRGTNMSFRRELLAAFPWDARLNGGAATDYEIDLCSWVRRQGFRLVYDPDAGVRHHLGPRPELGRDRDRDAIASYSHNVVYAAGKALSPPRAALAVAGAFLVGNRHSYGLLTAAADTALGRPPSLRDEVMPALAGKLAGLRSLAALRREGPLPLDGRG